jgi:hypothetical protein
VSADGFILAGVTKPLNDEPLDGWIDTLAALNFSSSKVIARRLGMPPIASPYRWVREVSDATASRIEGATGIRSDVVHTLTLHRWVDLDLKPSLHKRGHSGGTWPRGAGARFCPKCLTERGHRWRIQWYTQWAFACEEHGVLLSTKCPACGQPPRSRRTSAHPLTSGRGDCLNGCSLNTLEGSTAVPVSPDHPLWAAQRALESILANPRGIFTGLGEPMSAFLYLRDVASLARTAILSIDSNALPISLERIPGLRDGALWTPLIDTDALARGGNSMAERMAKAVADSALAALSATAAVHVMSASCTHEAQELIQALGNRPLHGAFVHGQPMSHALLRVLAKEMTPARRYRRMLFTAHRMQPGSTPAVAPLQPRDVPAGLWPSVAARYLGASPDEYKRACLAVVMLAIGTSWWFDRAGALLGLGHISGRQARDWHAVVNADDIEEVIEDLVSLQACLSAGLVPIDYDRKRRTFEHPEPLGARKSSLAAQSLGLRPTPRFRHFAGWWIFESLTGTPALLTKTLLDLPGGVRLGYRRQQAEWTQAPPPALRQLAEGALLRHRIDEPILWQPEFDANQKTWALPPADLTRTLAGWSTRQLRRSSRPDAFIFQSGGHAWADDTARRAYAGRHRVDQGTKTSLDRFVVITEHESIRSAAVALNLSAATLSVTLGRLELNLGHALFERATSGQPQHLTEDGRLLIAAIERHRRSQRVGSNE